MGNRKNRRSSRRTVNKTLAQKFKTSYGVWSQLMEFMEPLKFLMLQLLDRYLYHFGIGRIQMSYRLMAESYMFIIEAPENYEKVDMVVEVVRPRFGIQDRFNCSTTKRLR